MAHVPSIFLSHTGEQKDFTRRLCQELLHVGHHPFFDQDLPRGDNFPARIVDACRGCKMGIVVLSHKYMESLWPMLELEQLTFHNPSILLYPLFYRLQPADLSSQDNLKRWQSKWDSKASAWPDRVRQASSNHSSINIKMSSWPEAIRRLKFQNGDVLHPHMEEDDFIREIVSNICRKLPPPQRYQLGDQFKGICNMQLDMDARFQREPMKSNGLIALGVYGVGGSGKSTLCKCMASFYDVDFPGRSCWLEFPSDQENHDKQLVEAIKSILPKLGGGDKGKIECISSIAEAMTYLEEGLKRHKVFLAMDNLWDWDLDNARQIVGMEYISGSRLMVTSRSKQVLRRLSLETMHVPSITKEAAVEALRSYSHAESFPHDYASPEDLSCLVDNCYYEGYCHPLLLKAVGDKLKQVGGRLNESEDWRNFLVHLQASRNGYDDQVEETVLKVLETSFLAMPTKLQRIFVDLVTCPLPTYSGSSSFVASEWEWLSMLHQGYTPEEMRYEFIQLEYHGLLEITTQPTARYKGFKWRVLKDTGEGEVCCCIHDLYKHVGKRHVSQDAACKSIFQGGLSIIRPSNLKYAIATDQWPFKTRRRDLIKVRTMRPVNYFSTLEILVVSMGGGVKWLSVQGMVSLRFLNLVHCYHLKSIKGWEGAPNLISIQLIDCPSLQKVGDIGCLQKLQELVICANNLVCVPDLTGCCDLEALYLSGCQSLESLASLGKPPKLQVLVVDCDNVADLTKLGIAFTALQGLYLRPPLQGLQKFPDVNLSNLVRLNLEDCDSLVNIEGSLRALRSLEELVLTNCESLQRIPSLENLGRLKVFKADKCCSLRELQFGVSALTSLEICDLRGCKSLWCRADLKNVSMVKMEELLGVQLQIFNYGSIARDQPTFMGAFAKLLVLALDGTTFSHLVLLDVSGLVNLEQLTLESFPSLQVVNITGLGALRT